MNPQSETPKPKSGRGCLIALGVLGALGVLSVLAVVIAGVVFLQSDTGKQVRSAFTKGIDAFQQASNAPGAEELRKLGCEQAMVVDQREVMKVFNPEGLDAGRSGGIKLLVICHVGVLNRAPSCDDVAKTYVKAVGRASSAFLVEVGVAARSEPKCQKFYAEDGEELEEPPTDWKGPTAPDDWDDSGDTDDTGEP